MQDDFGKVTAVV